MPPTPPDPDPELTWTEVSRETDYRCAVFDVVRTGRRPAGVDQPVHDFFVLETRDWVTVVPLVHLSTPSFLMVRQYRHGIEAMTLEFPAGLVEPGEPPETAARRELLEETGHQAAALAHVGTLAAAPAFMNNRCHIYVAWGLDRVSDQKLDPGERIEPVVLAVEEVKRRIGTGELVNAVTATSLLFYTRWAASDRAADQDRS